MPSGGEVREERPGPGHADEVRGSAAPQKGLRIPGPDIRAPGDPRHGAGHHPTGERLAEARVRTDPQEDKGRRRGLRG